MKLAAKVHRFYTASKHIQPRAGVLQAAVYGYVILRKLCLAAHFLGALVYQPPDAVAVRVDLAVAVRAGAAAGAVSDLLGATHWAGERVMAQDALAAVLAAEHRLFYDIFRYHCRPIQHRVLFAKLGKFLG